MYTESAFKAELGNLLPGDLNNNLHKDACWIVYQNAANTNNKRLVAGLIDDLHVALEKLGRTSLHQKGSVLRTSAWSIFLNDSWILGGIHGHINFELISIPSNESIISKDYKKGDPADRIFRVTGRELIGLTSFGYAQVYGPVEKISSEIRPSHLPYCNALIQCVDKGAANDATFTRYREVIAQKAGEAAEKGWRVVDGLIG